ncbi:MAG: extracellular solute-binding protein, partial [Clostridia bacterium]
MQKHNKIFSLCLSILFIVVALLSFTACADNVDNNGGSNKLVIYNWAEYIYPDWETDFKDYYREKTGKEIDLTYVTFDTNETLLSKVFNNDAQVDVMCPSEYAAQKLMEGGYLKPLNYFTSDSYENAKYVNKHITSALERAFSNVEISEGETANMVDYMVPYMWGTLGILYNADLLMSNGITDEDVARAGWGILWNKDENGKEFSADVDKRILMKDSIRDSYAAAVLYMKQYGLLDKLEGGKYASLTNEQLINTTEQELIDAVQQVLIDQKDVLYGYEVDFGKD